MLSKNLLAVAAAAVPAFAQSSTPNLTALIGSDDRLSTLGQILQSYPDVAATLANATNVTVLAPSNDAFNRYLTVSGMQLSDVSEGMVAALLQYHVLNGTYEAANVTESPQFIHTLLMNETYTNVTDGQVVGLRLEDGNVIATSGYKIESTVVEADLNFTGGVAHIIDGVNIIPANISDTASAANLTYFLGALAATNLTSALNDLSDVTVFAPSNSAFESIGSALSNISTEALTRILQYHVINGTIAYSPSIGNGSVETLGGSNVNLTVADNAIFVNQARVVNADALVANGVMHVIDAVLNPNGTAMANPEDDNSQEGFDGASSVASLPLTSGVPLATTTVNNLITTTLEVASGYSTVTEAIGSGAGGSGATETSEEGAAMVTGAVGMAALFGAGALMANM